MAKSPTILITGINGYLGQYIAEECENYQAIIIGTGREDNTQKWQFRAANLLNFNADILLDGVDIVIHTAAIIPSKQQNDNFENNVIMTQNLVQACVAKQVKHLIHISSASIYKKSSQPHLETSDIFPDNAYGQSKLRCEEELKKHSGKLQISILRMGTIFGPDMPQNNNIQRLLNALKTGRFIQLGTGKNKKSLIHVNDAARSCAHLAFTYKPGKNQETHIFNIAPPPLEMKQIINTICDGLGKKKPISIPMPIMLFIMKLLAPIARIFKPIAAIENSITKFLSDDVLNGNKFITQTEFEFRSDNLHEILQVSQMAA